MLRLSERALKSAVKLALFKRCLAPVKTEPMGVNVTTPNEGGSEIDASPVIHDCVELFGG